jgi:PPIC-type PPIASE domain
MNFSIFGGTFRMGSIGAPVLLTAIACSPFVATAQTPPYPQRIAQAVGKPKAAAPAMPVAPAATAAQPGIAATQGSPAKAAGDKPASDKAGGGGDVIARVGGTNISADEVRSYVTSLGPRERAALGQDPALLSQAVRMMLANRLVLQEVIAKKWDQQPVVAVQLDRVRENAVVELYLQTVSVPPASFPNDDELQKVYDANRAAMLMPRQFQLAQIFVALPNDADKAAEDKAKKSLDDIQRKLKAPGADFGAIANENDAKNGGDLGWLVENQIRPEIRTAVMPLAKNANSEPIRLDDGWHILKVVDTKASYTRTLPEVRDVLVQQMRSERAAAQRRAYVADLLKQHPPVINELALSNLLGEQASAAR